MTEQKSHGLYRLKPQDIDKASVVLNSSFSDYPDFAYVFPDKIERERNLRHVMKFLIRLCMLRGEALSPSKNLEGISLWYRPGAPAFSFGDIIKSGIFPLLFHADWESFRRFKKLGDSKKEFRCRRIRGDYYLLDMIGVESACRNQGHGRVMIEEKLRGIDRERMPCYLETSSEINVQYYHKYGFHTIHENDFYGIRSYLMLRGARDSDVMISMKYLLSIYLLILSIPLSAQTATKIYESIDKGDIEAFSRSINRGNVNSRNSDGETPLSYLLKKSEYFASSEKYLDVLFKNGADPNLADRTGAPPASCRI